MSKKEMRYLYVHLIGMLLAEFLTCQYFLQKCILLEKFIGQDLQEVFQGKTDDLFQD